MLHLNQRSRLEPRPIRFVAPEPCCVALPTPVGGYFLIEANSDLGWKSFDSDPVGAVVGTDTGCGMTMIGAIGEWGGPCPLPSCATAAVVTDVMSKSVTIVYFILILLERGGSTRRRRRAYALCPQHRRIQLP